MKRTALARGSRTKAFRSLSILRRAVAETLESRNYLSENPFWLGFSYDEYTTHYEGEYLSFQLDFAESPYGVPNYINVAWGPFGQGLENGVDFSPDGTLVNLTVFLADDSNSNSANSIYISTGEGDYWTFYPTVQNVNPTVSTFNNVYINEGGTANVNLSLSDVGEDNNFHYSFALDPNQLATDYASAQTEAWGTFGPFTDHGVYTVHARGFDDEGGYVDTSTTVIVWNVAPYATLTYGDPDINGNVTVSLTNANDPSSVDTAEGFRYSFNTTYNNLAGSYTSASTQNYAVFSEAQLAGGATVHARIFDDWEWGYRNYSIGTTDMSAVVVSSSQINLTWTDNVTDELGWRVQWSDDGSFDTGHVWYENLDEDISEYNATVPDGTRRWFRVRAYGDATHPGQSIYSPKMAQTTYLPPPTNVQASNINHSSTDMDIEVTWDSGSQNQTGFTLKRFAAGVDVTTATPLQTLNLGATARNYTLEGYEPGDLFQFILQAVGAYNTSSVTPAFENRTEPVGDPLELGGWFQAYDPESGPNDDLFVTANWTEPHYDVDGPYYENEVVEFTLSNLPRHTYATVDIHLNVSSGDPDWPLEYPAPTASVGGTPLRAQVKARLEAEINWDWRVARFTARDIAVNAGYTCEMHTWETAQGGGCKSPKTAAPDNVMNGVTYDQVDYHRTEKPIDVHDNYHQPDYSTYDPQG